jgi:predicted RNase H-like HicB family nuclease
MTNQFTLIVESDIESGWIVGQVAELPGCYTQAQNMVDLEENMRDAIQVYLDTYKDILQI